MMNKTDTSIERFEKLTDSFDEAQTRRDTMEQNRADRIFRRSGGTDDMFLNDRPPQKWLLALEEACMDDARAIEPDIEKQLQSLQDLADADEQLPKDRLDALESGIAGYLAELDKDGVEGTE